MGCENCPRPGTCCKFIYFPIGDLDPIKVVEGMPFKFLKRAGQNSFYSCSNLGEDGRCKDYENRPQVCRDTIEGEANCCIKSKIHLTEEQRKDMMNDDVHR